MNYIKPLFALMVIAAFHASAETAYRSVDEQGNVTFSDRPVGDAVQEEQISVNAPVLSGEQQQQALQREAELQQAASQSGSSDEGSPENAARQAVQDAEKRLDDAKQVRDGDRIGTAGGGSRLTPEYHERVRKAEAEVGRALLKQDSAR